MNDPPQLLRPSRQLSSQSPTRHRHTPSASDDFLTQLAPSSAVDALTSATGSLRACLEGASASERDFTMRTAVASKMIWDWVNELSDWRWPGNGGSAGFEMPKSAQRKPAILVTGPTEQQEDEEYMGSLPVEEFARYELRIDTIHRDMMELEVEDIKSHVLTNHILPLSRPGTPMSGMSRSSSMLASATTSYNKMEDISAVITAIVVQTLPNLARLSRLLQIWSTRLRVLQQVPRLLRAIEDAEVALMSGWNAITAPASKSATSHGSSAHERVSLTKEHFGVMKTVIEKKVTSGGRIADHILDCLEGQADTIPDEWLDKLERVENDYAEWVAACERRVQETEWAKSKAPQQPPNQQLATEKVAMPMEQSTVNHPQIERPQQSMQVGDNLEQTGASLEHVSAQEANYSPIASNSLTQRLVLPQPEQTNGDTPTDKKLKEDSGRDRPIPHLDGADSDSSRLSLSPPLPIVSLAEAEEATSEPFGDLDVPLDEDSAFPDLDDDVELPALHGGSRRDSVASQTSTVMHGASSHFADSDMPEISASPDVVRMQIREAKYVDTSPPSSPPLPTEDSSGGGKKPANISVNGAVSQTEEAPRTPLDSSFADDYDDSYSVSEAAAGSPSKRRESSGDIQLRQQISQIIENIPAKIKLTSETPNVNLNPPDLQLPKMRKKASIDRFRRSGSALSTVSSRSGTPAFTLSPAKNGRLSRAQRGQQEIKVYHLSRSTGEAPIKLFIRCVGENGERVMVRVGGGWADLSEYLKEYASHHKRRSAAADGPKVEIRDVPRVASGRGTAIGSSPPSRPGSALDSPLTPLNVRKPRRSSGAVGNEVPRLLPRTPAAGADDSLGAIPQSEDSIRSRSSSRLSWVEEDSSFLGLSGPNGKRVEMSDENKAWVESVKEKVRLASGERRVPPTVTAGSAQQDDVNSNKGRFGELGKVGGTKRLFRKSEDLRKK
ncbi:growth-Arrest-Specific protein 2 domain-containing protein [Sarocladium implicatum]|nr:growth-Arrest-Specific protein 2 domain-containing protein [Sarocladium implicatum]